LAFATPLPDDGRVELVMSQVLARVNPQLVRSDPQRLRRLDERLDTLAGTRHFIDLVQRFDLRDRFAQVRQLAIDQPASLGVDAVRMLLASGQAEMLAAPLQQQGSPEQLALIAVLGRSADNRALPLLRGLLSDDQAPMEVRRAAIHSLAQLRAGAEFLLGQAEAQQLAASQVQAVAAELHQVGWRDLRERALKIFPLAPSKDDKPLPSLGELAQRRGDASRGETVFRTTGTCHKCHVVQEQGTQVGPNLSEIGNKLSREALLESILYPSAAISHSYETYAVELADGNVVQGVMVSQTADQVEIKNNEGITRRFARRDIDQISQQPLSLMPADLHQQLTEGELIDLVEYLLTLKQPTGN
jgi:putative heme-binding domain-containing protein